jgi:hypothetical protein
MYSDAGPRTHLAVPSHLVKRIRPRFWAALDVNYYTGGRTTVDQELTAIYLKK